MILEFQIFYFCICRPLIYGHEFIHFSKPSSFLEFLNFNLKKLLFKTVSRQVSRLKQASVSPFWFVLFVFISLNHFYNQIVLKRLKGNSISKHRLKISGGGRGALFMSPPRLTWIVAKINIHKMLKWIHLISKTFKIFYIYRKYSVSKIKKNNSLRE